MAKPGTDLLEDMHVALTKALLEKVKSGDATAAELGVARQMLKDNGIEAVPTQDNPLEDLANSLPTYDEEDPDAPGKRLN